MMVELHLEMDDLQPAQWKLVILAQVGVVQLPVYALKFVEMEK